MTEAIATPYSISEHECSEIPIAAMPIGDDLTSLPGEWSETSCILPEGLPHQQWRQMGGSLLSAVEIESRRASSIHWVVGDWLLQSTGTANHG